MTKENEDGLGLPNAKEIFRHGVQRFWSYTMVNGDRETVIKYAATKGLNLVTHIDYLIFYASGIKPTYQVGWDAPEKFSTAFIERVGRYGVKHHLFTK